MKQREEEESHRIGCVLSSNCLFDNLFIVVQIHFRDDNIIEESNSTRCSSFNGYFDRCIDTILKIDTKEHFNLS